MSYHHVQTARGREGEDFSFFDALNFESKEPAVRVSEGLHLSAFPNPPPDKQSHTSEGTTLQKTLTNANGSNNPSKPKPVTKMGTPTRAQLQCLELCHKTTAQIDRISVHILEYLTTTKQLPYGFEPLAHDFLDTCQILFSIEAGLAECNRTLQKFPPAMITELDHKFRVTQADFHILDQMLSKMLGNSGLVKRSWGKLFGDTDIKKITSALAKTRESLGMSSLIFQWSLGSEKVGKEMGIGYTGLSAALDRMDQKAGNMHTTQTVNNSGDNPLPQLPPSSPLRENSFQQQQLQQQPLHSQSQLQQLQLQHQMPSGPMTFSDRSSSIQPDFNVGRMPVSPNLNLEHLLSPDYRHHGVTALPAYHIHNDGHHSSDSYDRASTLGDAHSMVGRSESDGVHDDYAGLDLDHSKIIRHTIDPTSLPRAHVRSTIDSESANMKVALISAVRNKNHKLLEQLLNRGVSANTGPNMNALKEAVLARDDECIRVLLLFGADPNDPDRDGNTPLFVAVEKAFVSGTVTLLKYGADPNLVAGPDMECPLAVAVGANLMGLSHLLMTYNGDANHVTANGNTLLIGSIKKKTPKKLVELLLNYGSNPNAKSQDGRTALFEAIQVGRADIVTALLDHGANPNLPGPKHMLWPSTNHADCLKVLLSHGADHKKCPGIMELAVSFNNLESVQMLLKAGVDPNTKKDGAYTPLCTAIRDDRPDLLELLLSNGADANVKASEYPTFKCVTHDRVHFLPTLVAAGANLNQPKGILETAVSCKNLEALNWLLDAGVSPNDKTLKGLSPLTTAIREDRLDMVDLLLLRGADPHMRGQDWPLCMAVRNPPILERILTVVTEPQAFKGVVEMAVSANQLESVKLLLAAGVSVEDKNGGVFSPLTTALRENHRDIVRYLLSDGGADVNAPGEHLPIVKALRRFHGEDTEMLELLLEHGADANKIYRGWNAIMQAVENGDPDVLTLLGKKAGFDLGAKDELGRTVVEIAASRGWDEAVQILKAGDLRRKA